MTGARVTAALLAMATLALRAAPAPAQDRLAEANEEEALLTGGFVLAEPSARAGERIDAAIDAVVDPMGFIVRDIARGKLRGKNPVHQRMSVSVRGERVVVAYDGDRFATDEGQWREVTAGGERVQLRQEVDGERIIQTFRTADGEKRMVLTFSPDRRSVALDIRVTSPRLPEPLRYRLLYRRISSAPSGRPA